jgi:hypothetical protein
VAVKTNTCYEQEQEIFPAPIRNKYQDKMAAGSAFESALQYPPFPENLRAYLNISSASRYKCTVFLQLFKLLRIGILTKLVFIGKQFHTCTEVIFSVNVFLQMQ